MNSSTSNSKVTDSNRSKSFIQRYGSMFLLFILCIFLFDRGIFWSITRIERGFYGKDEFEGRFERYVKDKDFSTLIFGTSRTHDGIHPHYLEKYLHEKAFKEAYQGKGPKYYYYFYQMYKKHAGIPKVVIYGIDYFIYTVQSDQKYMSRFHLDDGEGLKEYLSPTLLLLKYKKRFDSLYNHFLIAESKPDPGKEDEAFAEFEEARLYIGPPPGKNRLITEKPKDYLRQLYPHFPGAEGHFFMKLLKELEKDKVTVILVGLPDFFGTYKTNFQRDDFIADMKELESRFKYVHFYNYNRRYRFPLDNEDYFLDGGYGLTNSHLSSEGARVFNRILCQDLKKYYRRKDTASVTLN